MLNSFLPLSLTVHLLPEQFFPKAMMCGWEGRDPRRGREGDKRGEHQVNIGVGESGHGQQERLEVTTYRV